MTEQEFNELLKQIENNYFITNKLSITMDFFDEEYFKEKLNNEQVISLAKVLKKNPHITILDLTGNNIRDEGAIALANIDTLEELNLYGNNVGPKGAKALAKSNLKILSLQENCTKDSIVFNEERYDQFLEMINTFITNFTIINLNLYGCYISDKLISQLISKNKTIKNLDLGSNYLTDKALEFIEENIVLEQLNLSKNDITDKSTEYIARNTSLKILGLEKTKITDIGAELLSTHSTLRKLNIIDSEITIKGLKYFVSSNLDEIWPHNNNISEQELYNFYSAFEEGKKNKELMMIEENEHSIDIEIQESDVNYNGNWTNLSGENSHHDELS